MFIAVTRAGLFFMKKSDLSEAASNVLIFSSVTVALMPLLLGDQLFVVVTGCMKEGGVMVDQFSAYVIWLFS
jgi:hypothetical protein